MNGLNLVRPGKGSVKVTVSEDVQLTEYEGDGGYREWFAEPVLELYEDRWALEEARRARFWIALGFLFLGFCIGYWTGVH